MCKTETVIVVSVLYWMSWGLRRNKIGIRRFKVGMFLQNYNYRFYYDGFHFKMKNSGKNLSLFCAKENGIVYNMRQMINQELIDITEVKK